MRVFSVPYNGDNPKQFLKHLERFKENVHDVYLGLPNIPDFFSAYIISKNKRYYQNCEKFLEEVKDSDLKTVITLNADYRKLKPYEKDVIVSLFLKNADKYNIHGVVCSDLYMAKKIHQENNFIEINTSCNCPHYWISHIFEWRNEAGVSLVNPPRDASRNTKYLAELKNAGFRIKLLVNEPCYVNCPNICSFCKASDLSHACYMVDKEPNPLASCIVFPEWLKDYDSLVDIYKITGRYLPTSYIFNILDIYITGRSCNIYDIIPIYPKELNFNTSEIREYLQFCINHNCKECKHCLDFMKRLEGN